MKSIFLNIKLPILLFVLVGFSFHSQSQLTLQGLIKITDKDGLPEAQINCSVLDDLNFLWLGTRRGLYKYDGRIFKNIIHYDIDLGKNIKCIYKIDHNHILVGTDYGLAKVNILNHDVKVVHFISRENGNPRGNNVHQIVGINKEEFIVATTGGVFTVTNDLKINAAYFFPLADVETASHLQPPRIWVIDSNTIWIVGPISSQLDNYQIYELKHKNLKLLKSTPFNDFSRFLSLIMVDQDHGLYCFENSSKKIITGICTFSTMKFQEIPGPSSRFLYFQPFFSEPNENLLGMDSKGFEQYWFFNKSTKTWTGVEKKSDFDFLKTMTISERSIYAASTNYLFISSTNDLPFIKQIVVNNNHQKDVETRFSYATSKQYKIISKNNNIYINNQNLIFDTITLTPEDLKLNQLTFMNDVEVLLATNSGSYVLNASTGKYYRLNGKNKPDFFDQLTSKHLKINNAEIWFGFTQFKGLVRYDFKNKIFKHYPFTRNDEKVFFHDISDFTVDLKGNLWFGWIGGGLGKFDTKNETFVMESKNKSQYKDVIRCLHTDKKGNVWFGTEGYGLYYFHPDSMIFRSLKQKINPYVNDVYSDENDHIWFSTSTGLYKYHLGTNTLELIDRKKGLISNNVNKIYKALDAANLIITTDNGICEINTNNIPEKIEKHPIYINKLFINNARKDERQKIWDLNYNENNIKIEFSSPNIFEGHHDAYEYTLDNAFKNWQSCDDGIIHLSALQNGNHKVRLKICSQSNNCQEVELLEFNIELPFWKTPLFFIVLSILFFTIVYFYFRVRMLHLKKLNNYKLNIARDLHDNIGSNLSSISFLSSAILKQSNQNPELLAQKIKESSIEAGNSIEEIIWNLHPKKRSVADVLNRLAQQFNEVFETKNIQFYIHIENDCSQIYLNNVDTVHLLMILKEICNNVLKHSKASEFTITLMVKNNNQLQLHCVDNGIGFKPETVSGNGLENINTRIKQMGGIMSISSSPHGSTFRLETAY